MNIKLFPKDQTFFKLFAQQVDLVVQASELFLQIAIQWPNNDGKVDRMVALENQGDALARIMIAHLNKSFVTPVDREDIHGIAVLMDDILDLFQSVSVRMNLYDMQLAGPGVTQMAQVLVQCSTVLKKAVGGLEHMDNVSALFEEMQKLENEGDDINRAALAELYRQCQDVKDVVYLMQYKDIISRLEDAVDKLKKMFEMLQQVIIKHA